MHLAPAVLSALVIVALPGSIWCQFDTVRKAANVANNITSTLTFGIVDSRNYRLKKDAVLDSIRKTGKKWIVSYLHLLSVHLSTPNHRFLTPSPKSIQNSNVWA